MRRSIFITTTMAVCLLGAIAILSAGGHNNPLGTPGASIEANLNIPPDVAQSINKACRNCHSNETKWPWYSKVPPASWLVEKDVQRARNAMNLSEWSTQPGKDRRAGATLLAACEDAKSGRMPLAGYRLLHPESRLSKAEVSSFCEWTNRESQRLREKNQKR